MRWMWVGAMLGAAVGCQVEARPEVGRRTGEQDERWSAALERLAGRIEAAEGARGAAWDARLESLMSALDAGRRQTEELSQSLASIEEGLETRSQRPGPERFVRTGAWTGALVTIRSDGSCPPCDRLKEDLLSDRRIAQAGYTVGWSEACDFRFVEATGDEPYATPTIEYLREGQTVGVHVGYAPSRNAEELREIVNRHPRAVRPAAAPTPRPATRESGYVPQAPSASCASATPVWTSSVPLAGWSTAPEWRVSSPAAVAWPRERVLGFGWSAECVSGCR